MSTLISDSENKRAKKTGNNLCNMLTSTKYPDILIN